MTDTQPSSFVGHVVDPDDPRVIVSADSPRGRDILTSARTAPAPRLNGSFAAIIREERETIAITDPTGTVPIYQADVAGTPDFSVDWIALARSAGLREHDEDALLQSLIFGYALGERTYVAGLRELAPATIRRVNHQTGAIDDRTYWTPRWTGEITDLDEAVGEYERCFDAIADRYGDYAASLNDPVLIKLTGGGDSRLLLALFLDTPGIVTATYRFAGGKDALIAASIARQAGVPHHIVDLAGTELADPDILAGAYDAAGCRSRASSPAGTLAIARALRDASARFVHIPGHTGDFVTGGHIKPFHLDPSTTDPVAPILRGHALHARYRMLGPDEPVLAAITDPDRLTEAIRADLAPFADRPMWEQVQMFNQRNRQRRLIHADSAALRQSGQTLLPFWDLELMELCQRLSLDLLVGQRAFFAYVDRLAASDRFAWFNLRWPVNRVTAPCVLREAVASHHPIRVASGLARVTAHRVYERFKATPAATERYCARIPPSQRAERIDAAIERFSLDKLLTPQGLHTMRTKGEPWIFDLAQLLRAFDILHTPASPPATVSQA